MMRLLTSSAADRTGPSRGRTRSAFTLVELILVLVIIVVLAGMAWPRLVGFLKSESLQGNVEQVRQMLDHARVQAVEDGIIYQFRFEPYGRKFVLLPYELQSTEQQTATSGGTPTSGAAGTSSLTSSKSFLPTVHELSEDCSFHVENSLLSGEPVVYERLGDPWLNMLSNGILNRDVSWSAPILYAPDGSANGGTVTIVDKDRRVITLSVRGLTGAVVTSRLSQLPETYGAMQ